MGYSGYSTYVDGKNSDGSYFSGKNTTFSDGSGGTEGTRYVPGKGTEYVSTYYHDGSSTETYTSYSGGK